MANSEPTVPVGMLVDRVINGLSAAFETTSRTWLDRMSPKLNPADRVRLGPLLVLSLRQQFHRWLISVSKHQGDHLVIEAQKPTGKSLAYVLGNVGRMCDFFVDNVCFLQTVAFNDILLSGSVGLAKILTSAEGIRLDGVRLTTCRRRENPGAFVRVDDDDEIPNWCPSSLVLTNDARSFLIEIAMMKVKGEQQPGELLSPRFAAEERRRAAYVEALAEATAHIRREWTAYGSADQQRIFSLIGYLIPPDVLKSTKLTMAQKVLQTRLEAASGKSFETKDAKALVGELNEEARKLNVRFVCQKCQKPALIRYLRIGKNWYFRFEHAERRKIERPVIQPSKESPSSKRRVRTKTVTHFASKAFPIDLAIVSVPAIRSGVPGKRSLSSSGDLRRKNF